MLNLTCHCCGLIDWLQFLRIYRFNCPWLRTVTGWLPPAPLTRLLSTDCVWNCCKLRLMSWGGQSPVLAGPVGGRGRLGEVRTQPQLRPRTRTELFSLGLRRRSASPGPASWRRCQRICGRRYLEEAVCEDVREATGSYPLASAQPSPLRPVQVGFY